MQKIFHTEIAKITKIFPIAEMDHGSIQIRFFFVIFATSVWNLLVDAAGTIRGPMKKIFSHGDRKDHEDFSNRRNG